MATKKGGTKKGSDTGLGQMKRSKSKPAHNKPLLREGDPTPPPFSGKAKPYKG